MGLSKLPSGSLASQVTANHKEFRVFAEFMTKFMKSTQQRYHALQGDFAIALHNHETRIKELEAKVGITPKQEIQQELEQLIADSAEDLNKAEEVFIEPSEEPVTQIVLDDSSDDELPVQEDSKIRYHKEF